MDHTPAQFAIHLPDGRVASEREMRNVGSLLKLYVLTTEERLPEIVDDAEHDRMVGFLRLLAKRFNELLCLFRATEEECRHQREMLLARGLAQWFRSDNSVREAIRH